jgi:hypothetical protein
VVSNSAGTVTSIAATLTVNAAPVAPTITTQPASQTVTAGQTATFTVVAGGTAPLSYQWKKNGANIGGATSASYTTSSTTTADSGSTFAVVVTNTAGTVTSIAATLTVNAAPVAPAIMTQPASQTVTAGQTATFTAAATGTAPLSYQWKKSGATISGATSLSYTTPATTSLDNGAQFTVVVSNTVGSATSNAATLTVSAPVVGPAISSVSVSGISTSGAIVSWTTDVAATSQVEYGTTTAYGKQTTLDVNLVQSHTVTLTGLTTNTLYHYRVHSKNSSGVESISGDFAFQTSNVVDTTPPTVSITAPANGATVSATVSVTANASDNVAVTSVQFVLDGTNLGSAVTTAPYSVSWNTTSAANGTHTLTAQARDAAGNVGNATAVIVTVSNSTSTALQDFQTRCAQPGVIVCQGFDDPAIFSAATYPASGNYPGTGTFDPTVSASGAGSLKFTIPSKGDAGVAGYWRQLFTSNLSSGPGSAQMFGQNSTFYVQFRQRMSPEFITNQWPASGGGTTNWKQEIFSNDGASCANVELTTVNQYNRGFPQMYSQCGSDVFQVPIPVSDFLLEQGDTTGYNCHYQAQFNVAGSCFLYPGNTWVTYYYKVTIGTWGQPNSTIQAWVSVGGGPYKQWINITNHSLYEDTAGADYNMVMLLPYMTNRDSSVSAGPVAYTWYDELIVSSQQIAAPNN